MQLNVKRRNNETADGVFTVKAKGCVLAYLYWANEDGALSDWTAFGVVPLHASNSTGSFILKGERAIPKQTSHILVRAVSEDFKTVYEELFPFENSYIDNADEIIFRATVLSDLHTTNKVGTLNRALETVKGKDCLLLTGDMTNDGAKEQFDLLEECINEIIPGIPVFKVNGNHDLLSDKIEFSDVFYEAIDDVDIIGINAEYKWETVMSVTKLQLAKVDTFLQESTAKHHIIMIHTPLERNMPIRNGHLSHYISCDRKLQELIDSHSNILVLSGHTHLSPSLDSGVVFRNAERNNIYINCGSIRPTELASEGLLAPKDWVYGNNVELTLSKKGIEIKMKQIHGEKYISRGYYSFLYK